ncbi:MAG: tetratricopeptide repeat protein, partial [Planctomycetaceae bacterium]
MNGRQRPSQSTRRAAARPWRRVAIGGVLLALFAAIVFGRGAAAWWARREAARHLEAGAVGAAERQLARADWFDADDFRTDLLRAACFRHVGQREDWAAALAAAERHGARNEHLELETRLGDLRWGLTERVSADDYDTLAAAGASPREALTSVVYGLLARRESRKAEELIEAWEAESGDAAQASYLRGVCWWSTEREDSARVEFEKALDRQPGHEPARAALARMLEQQDQFAAAHAHYAVLASAAPERESARVDLARILRKRGRLEDARAVLEPALSAAEVSQNVAVEQAEIEYESGNYEAARRWFERTDLDGAHLAETLRAAAGTFAFNGDVADAERLFARVDEAQSLSRRLGELQRRLAIDPGDRTAAEELRRLQAAPAASAPQAVTDNSPTGPVSPLYLRHCAACHGADGHGDGRAARYLSPRPRDLRGGKHRLVSTLNGAPTLEDIERVIRLGIPGTAMPAFSELPADQRTSLARQVQQFRREGLRERILQQLREHGAQAQDDDLRRTVADLAAPGE